MAEVKVKVDEGVFTAMCALNTYGYDDKNRPAYHSVRRKIRKSLKAKKFKGKSEIREELEQYPWWQVQRSCFYLTNAPDFKLEHHSNPSYWKEYGKMTKSTLGELGKLLKRFYESAEIHNVWLDNLEAYEEERKIAEETIEKMKPVEKLENFLRTEVPVEKVVSIVELMEAWYRGCSYSTEKGTYILMGPCEDKDTQFYGSNTLHEAFHPVIGPQMEKYSDLVEKSSYLREEVPEGTQAHGYDKWKKILEETIVRVVVYHCIHKQNTSLKFPELEKMGFVHAPKVSKEIEKYMKSNEKFQDYLPKILESLTQKK